MGFFFGGGGGAAVDLASPPAIGNTTPNTGAFTTLSFAPANNATGFSNTGNSLTGSNAQSLISLAQTWNTTGNPIGIYFNVTNTASGTTAKFLDFLIGGTTRWAVDKNGSILLNIGNFVDIVDMTAAGAPDSFIRYDGSRAMDFSDNFSTTGSAVGKKIRVASDCPFGWSSGTTSSQNASDITMFRDAAGVLGIRTSTSAQSVRIYNTYTSATNFERLNLRWASNEFILDAENGSAGGTLRGVKIGSATTSLLGFYGVTPVDQPATVTDPTGGGTQDAEARTAINAIIDRLQELGLIA